jgi:hypothetical protein
MRCNGCGEPFEPRRRDQRWCTAGCRHRGFARARVESGRQALAALDALRTWIEAEVARWEPVAAGRRRRRGTP